MSGNDAQALELLEERLRTILPEEYQDSYEELEPVSMGSAGLKYGDDGRVAWNEIWGSFCDLAMAGGPPHKGSLLEPASRSSIDAEPERYAQVVDEICRGITLVTGLAAQRSPHAGWVRVYCQSEGMAAWLLRAIVMENIAVRAEGPVLELPAGPAFRLEKEIKNVITVIAKTCHYWTAHMWRAQHREIADLFVKMEEVSPLIKPAGTNGGAAGDAASRIAARIAEQIRAGLGLERSAQSYSGWLGVCCPTVKSAVWMMRTMVASNILSRREGTTLFVPVNPAADPDGSIVIRSLTRLYGFAAAKGLL